MILGDDECFTPHGPIDPQRTAAAVANLEAWLEANPCPWKFEDRPCGMPPAAPLVPWNSSGHAVACTRERCVQPCPKLRSPRA